MSTGWPYKQGTKFKDVMDVVTEVVIGEFADHDKQQGAAIDHSIATGEPLFTPVIQVGQVRICARFVTEQPFPRPLERAVDPRSQTSAGRAG